MKVILISTLILVAFIAGVFVGDRVGIDSRAYYDAAPKIKVLSSVVAQNRENEWVSGNIIEQIRILNEQDITPFKSRSFLQLTGNKLFITEHEKYLAIIKDNPIYQEKMEFLCNHNEMYSGKCD